MRPGWQSCGGSCVIPQFSICIPAYRNPVTLEACLRTVLDQPGDDYEILVSDDQGPPGIRVLVERLAQHDRIRYLRTPQRMGLRGNFEHYVAHSRGRSITILGDDDGLCRNALDVARTLLASTKPEVFFWFPHMYWWPDALLPHKRWMVYVYAHAKTARLVDPREYVDHFYDDPRNLWPFERLPSIYNGFVCQELLERIKHRTGGYFCDEVADVSSGNSTRIWPATMNSWPMTNAQVKAVLEANWTPAEYAVDMIALGRNAKRFGALQQSFDPPTV